MLSKMRKASKVRNSKATRIAGFMIGTVTRISLLQPLAPSTWAAFSRSSGTNARPASNSSAMNGVVFHTSARITTASDGTCCVSGALPAGSRFAR
ncbi:Uncharacterised protein [Mycobacteroides abscessus subsp. abscessus]|nr:Uncharacterised protein [Mycobacteroides abscessus subsp. abscessus]